MTVAAVSAYCGALEVLGRALLDETLEVEEAEAKEDAIVALFEDGLDDEASCLAREYQVGIVS